MDVGTNQRKDETMKGKIERDGTVTITWNLQEEKFQAPYLTLEDGSGVKMQWLPCEVCGRVCWTRWNVVSLVCSECERRIEEEYVMKHGGIERRKNHEQD